MTVVIKKIHKEDLEEVAEFLHLEMWPGISPVDWQRSLRPSWPFDVPQYGFQLRDNDELVGVYTAIYSERPIRANMERFCNLAAWYVKPNYRFHSIKLLKALLDQEDYHLTDLSPRPHVTKIMRQFKFKTLDTTLTVAPNLPAVGWMRRSEIVTDLDRIREMLSGDARRIFDDHRNLGSCRHLAIEYSGKYCHVIYVRQIRKNIPCATVLHVSESEVLANRYGQLSHFFLFRERTLVTIYEQRFLARRPAISFQISSPHAKLYRSSKLTERDIDNLYSELVTLVQPSQGQ